MVTTGKYSLLLYLKRRLEGCCNRTRSIMHDPEVFVDPEKFNSDRWLNEKGTIRDDLKHFDFGFGRR